MLAMWTFSVFIKNLIKILSPLEYKGHEERTQPQIQEAGAAVKIKQETSNESQDNEQEQNMENLGRKSTAETL